MIIVDTTTNEPDSFARMRELCAAKGLCFIDAPLARTPQEKLANVKIVPR